MEDSQLLDSIRLQDLSIIPEALLAILYELLDCLKTQPEEKDVSAPLDVDLKQRMDSMVKFGEAQHALVNSAEDLKDISGFTDMYVDKFMESFGIDQADLFEWQENPSMLKILEIDPQAQYMYGPRSSLHHFNLLNLKVTLDSQSFYISLTSRYLKPVIYTEDPAQKLHSDRKTWSKSSEGALTPIEILNLGSYFAAKGLFDPRLKWRFINKRLQKIQTMKPRYIEA